MKGLIFLLFIAFTSSIVFPGRLISNYCLGGQIENGICKCPEKTALIGKECKPCVGGSIIFNMCRCPEGKFLKSNECQLIKVCPPDYVRIFNNTCIKKCPSSQIRVGNTCKNCLSGYYKDEYFNLFQKNMETNLSKWAYKKSSSKTSDIFIS